VGLIELGAVWVAAAVLSLVAGILRGRPVRAFLFGVLFGPFALALVVHDLIEHRRRAGRPPAAPRR
jgi:choline-glycine betaine transporter